MEVFSYGSGRESKSYFVFCDLFSFVFMLESPLSMDGQDIVNSLLTEFVGNQHNSTKTKNNDNNQQFH